MLDCHVHIVGNGSSGSGITLSVRSPYHRFLARVMVRSLGLPASALKGNLDELYRDRLVDYVRGSSLTHAVILAHEHAYRDDGTVISNFGSMYVPNEYVLTLSKKYPHFLAGVSIHPARRDALQELQKCIDNGAVLMKCLPNCQNIDCSDERYVPFWECMAKHGIPLLAHTGGELSLPQYNPKLADPARLELPLKCGVTVIAAHCGTRSLLTDPHYLDTLIEMFARYPNLYGDTSGMQTPLRSRYFHILREPPFRDRLIHGSDLPIPISGSWSALWGHLNWSDYHESRKFENPLERDIVLKRAMKLPEESFTRLAKLIRR